MVAVWKEMRMLDIHFDSLLLAYLLGEFKQAMAKMKSILLGGALQPLEFRPTVWLG